MDIFEAIHHRRSIRKFTDAPVSDEQVEAMLKAAMTAPSAGNAQPWQFIVVRDKQLLEAVPALNPYAQMAPKAPVSILVCGDLTKEKYAGFWVQDCSAATQNLLLAAHALGLGAVWTGIYPIQDRVQGFQRLFGTPEHVIPLGLMVIGSPDQPSGPRDRYLADRVHQNTWS